MLSSYNTVEHSYSVHIHISKVFHYLKRFSTTLLKILWIDIYIAVKNAEKIVLYLLFYLSLCSADWTNSTSVHEEIFNFFYI